MGEGQKPGAFVEFGPLAKHLRYVERHSRKLARSTFYAMGRYQARLEQKGHLLGRIVDIGAELYAIACACVYADTHRPASSPTAGDEAFELADLFCKQARRRADGLFDELWANDDARSTRPPSRCSTAATRGSRRTCSTRRARAR